MKSDMTFLQNKHLIRCADIAVFVITVIVSFLMYFSLLKGSFGTELLLLSLLLIVLCFISRTYSFKALIEFLPAGIFCFVALLLLVLSGRINEYGFNSPVSHALKFVYLMFVQVAATVVRGFSRKRKSIVLNAVVLSLFISSLVSVIYVKTKNQYAIRYPEEDVYSIVFNFDHMYALQIILVAVLCCILFASKKEIKYMLLYIPFLIVGIYCVYVSLFTTALLLMIMGLVLVTAVRIVVWLYKKSKMTLFILLGVCVLLLLICVIFSRQISDLIYNMTENMNWLVRDRIRSVADTVFGTDHNLDYSYSRREELAGYSIETFKKHPVFGIGYGGYKYGVIGSHQEWQDMLGVFGIFGTLLFVAMMLFYSFISIKKAETFTDRVTFVIAIVLWIALGFLNPCLSAPLLMAVFVISPNITALNPAVLINLKKNQKGAK